MFSIRSTTKQFTAAAILRLRDHGKLTLDDITNSFPDFDARGSRRQHSGWTARGA